MGRRTRRRGTVGSWHGRWRPVRVATSRWVWGDIHRDVAPPDEGDPPAAPWVPGTRGSWPDRPLTGLYRPSADSSSANEGCVQLITRMVPRVAASPADRNRTLPDVAPDRPSGRSGRPSAPSATAAAVEARSTSGPSRTARAPAAVSSAISASVIPPSGPDDQQQLPGGRQGDRGQRGPRRPRAAPARRPRPRTRPASSAVDTGSVDHAAPTAGGPAWPPPARCCASGPAPCPRAARRPSGPRSGPPARAGSRPPRPRWPARRPARRGRP